MSRGKVKLGLGRGATGKTAHLTSLAVDASSFGLSTAYWDTDDSYKLRLMFGDLIPQRGAAHELTSYADLIDHVPTETSIGPAPINVVSWVEGLKETDYKTLHALLAENFDDVYVDTPGSIDPCRRRLALYQDPELLADLGGIFLVSDGIVNYETEGLDDYVAGDDKKILQAIIELEHFHYMRKILHYDYVRANGSVKRSWVYETIERTAQDTGLTRGEALMAAAVLADWDHYIAANNDGDDYDINSAAMEARGLGSDRALDMFLSNLFADAGNSHCRDYMSRSVGYMRSALDLIEIPEFNFIVFQNDPREDLASALTKLGVSGQSMRSASLYNPSSRENKMVIAENIIKIMDRKKSLSGEKFNHAYVVHFLMKDFLRSPGQDTADIANDILSLYSKVFGPHHGPLLTNAFTSTSPVYALPAPTREQEEEFEEAEFSVGGSDGMKADELLELMKRTAYDTRYESAMTQISRHLRSERGTHSMFEEGSLNISLIKEIYSGFGADLIEHLREERSRSSIPLAVFGNKIVPGNFFDRMAGQISGGLYIPKAQAEWERTRNAIVTYSERALGKSVIDGGHMVFDTELNDAMRNQRMRDVFLGRKTQVFENYRAQIRSNSELMAFLGRLSPRR